MHLRATMSDLRELMEEFIIWQKLRGDELRSRLALAATYRERNLSKFFLQTMKKIEKNLERTAVRNADYLSQVLDF